MLFPTNSKDGEMGRLWKTVIMFTAMCSVVTLICIVNKPEINQAKLYEKQVKELHSEVSELKRAVWESIHMNYAMIQEVASLCGVLETAVGITRKRFVGGENESN